MALADPLLYQTNDITLGFWPSGRGVVRGSTPGIFSSWGMSGVKDVDCGRHPRIPHPEPDPEAEIGRLVGNPDRSTSALTVSKPLDQRHAEDLSSVPLFYQSYALHLLQGFMSRERLIHMLARFATSVPQRG